MRVLLDTHVLLWWCFDDPRLSATVRDVVADRLTEVLVSSASAWEIATKYRLGKLPSASSVAQDVAACVERAGFTGLPITLKHAQRAGSWPQPHRDPFDRVLAAQSVLEDVPLITRDPAFGAFGLHLIW